MMRIAGWFNPLVYVYQNRVSELHEFIADSNVAKTGKKEHYEILLSQVFQTQDISFINQFFKTSLTHLNVLGRIFSFGSQYGQVKKRIIMLQKSRSKKVWQLKYFLLLPVIMGMLFYTSCERGSKEVIDNTIVVKSIENLSGSDEDEVYSKLIDLSKSFADWTLTVKDESSSMRFAPSNDGSYISGPNNEKINARVVYYSNFGEEAQKDDDQKNIESQYYDLLVERDRLEKSSGQDIRIIKNLDLQLAALKDKLNQGGSSNISFTNIDEVPIFPGCEDASDTRECFVRMIQRHVSKNFRYPEAAQEKGIQGKVYANFIIDEQGNITEIKKRGPDESLEDEVERIIMRLPKMVAGKHAGKAVRVPFSLPITFKLQ